MTMPPGYLPDAAYLEALLALADDFEKLVAERHADMHPKDRAALVTGACARVHVRALARGMAQYAAQELPRPVALCVPGAETIYDIIAREPWQEMAVSALADLRRELAE